MAQLSGDVLRMEGSESLNTAYPYGVGPRRPLPLAHRDALDAPPPLQIYTPDLASDGDTSTAFIPKTPGADGWLRLVFDEERFVESLTIHGYGSLSGEAPTLNNRVKRISVTPPGSAIDLPALSLELEDNQRPQTLAVHGRAHRQLTLSIEEIYPGQGDFTPISEVSVKLLPIKGDALRSALNIPEGAALSALRSPGAAGQYLALWSARLGGEQRGEIAGVVAQGSQVRVLWRSPIHLQYRGSQSLELIPEVVPALGLPALLLTYRFIDIGSTMTYARVYIVGGSGVKMAWETVLSMGEGQESRLLSFGAGKIYTTTHLPELGYSMSKSVFRYDPAYRQFRPADLSNAGVSVTVRGAQGQALGGGTSLLDQNASTAALLPGRGPGTTLRLNFSPERRIAALQLLPGYLGMKSTYTRPSQVTLTWPSGYSIESTVDDSIELQTLFEGWEGPSAQATPWIEVRVDEVYPAIPGTTMAIGGIEAWFLDPP